MCVCFAMQQPFAFCVEMSLTLHYIYILESLHMSYEDFHALSMWNILRENRTFGKLHTVRWRNFFSLLSRFIPSLFHFISANEFWLTFQFRMNIFGWKESKRRKKKLFPQVTMHTIISNHCGKPALLMRLAVVKLIVIKLVSSWCINLLLSKVIFICVSLSFFQIFVNFLTYYAHLNLSVIGSFIIIDYFIRNFFFFLFLRRHWKSRLSNKM